MTTTVIVMIIIGLIIIVASFFITEKLTKKEENNNLDLMTVDENYEFSEREQNIIKRKIEDAIASHAKDILYETNESLSSMANEKTLALGDYAVAVCDEIERNHKEVMFLYSMLEDKQKEIMKTVQNVDRVNADVRKILSEADNKINSLKTSEFTTVEVRETVLQESKPQSVVEQSANPSVAPEASADFFDNGGMEDEFDKAFDELDNAEIEFDETIEQEFVEGENSNGIILDMYNNGESIINIAKQLGLGVGEVKLVIDLYQGE